MYLGVGSVQRCRVEIRCAGGILPGEQPRERVRDGSLTRGVVAVYREIFAVRRYLQLLNSVFCIRSCCLLLARGYFLHDIRGELLSLLRGEIFGYDHDLSSISSKNICPPFFSASMRFFLYSLYCSRYL